MVASARMGLRKQQAAAIGFSDDFNRSNRDLSGDNGWIVPQGGWSIVSNAAKAGSNGPAGFAGAIHDTGLSGNYQAVLEPNTWLVFWANVGMTYFYICRGDFFFFYDGTNHLVSSLSGTNSSGLMEAIVNAAKTSITFKQNGVSVGTVGTVATEAKQYAGFYTGSATGADSFAWTP